MLNLKIVNIIKLWTPVFLWCVIIYYFSSVPNLKSDLHGQWDFILRKIAHITEYGILTFLFFRAVVQKLSFRKSIAYATIFSLIYAFFDEYHQLFVFGRNGSLIDVFIDSLGILFMFFLIYRLKFSIKR